MNRHWLTTGSILVSLGAALSTGCSQEAKLGIDIAPASGAAQSALSESAASSLSANASLRIGRVIPMPAADAATISRVRILVNEAKVNGTGKGCDHVESGPFVIDLSADEIQKGAHREFLVGAIAAGTYRDAEIEIEPLDNDKDQGDTSGAELADFKATGASILVDGTYQGKAFQFAGHFKAEQGNEGSFTVSTTTPLNLPFSLTTTNWFVDAAGNAIDPTDPAQHSALAVAICKTLDTELDAASGGAGGPGMGPGPGGRHGGGGKAHCVE